MYIEALDPNSGCRHIGANGWFYVSDKTLRTIVDLVAANPSIIDLDLSFFNIQASQVHFIAELIRLDTPMDTRYIHQDDRLDLGHDCITVDEEHGLGDVVFNGEPHHI